MKPQRLFFNPSLILAVLFILAVSVAPAMAADADSRYMSSFSAGSTGQGSPFSQAGGEKHPLTQKNTAGISAGSQVKNLGASSGTGDSAGNVDTARKNLPWWAWLIFAILIVLLVVATAGAAGAFGAAGAGAAAGGAAVGVQAVPVHNYVPNPVFPPRGPIVGPPVPPGH